MITIGIAEVDITPALGTRMSGLSEDRHATGILDPLFARAMVIDNGTDQLCFVTCDVLSVRRSTVVSARRPDDVDGDGDVDTSDLTTAIVNFTGALSCRLYTSPSPRD